MTDIKASMHFKLSGLSWPREMFQEVRQVFGTTPSSDSRTQRTTRNCHVCIFNFRQCFNCATAEDKIMSYRLFIEFLLILSIWLHHRVQYVGMPLHMVRRMVSQSKNMVTCCNKNTQKSLKVLRKLNALWLLQ